MLRGVVSNSALARRSPLAGCRPGVELAVACAKRRNYYASDAPKTDPAIGIEKERIAVGELLRANCTTGNSSPASAITWKLNGNLVSTLSLSLTFSLSLSLASPPKSLYIIRPRAVATWPYWMIKVPRGTPVVSTSISPTCPPTPSVLLRSIYLFTVFRWARWHGGVSYCGNCFIGEGYGARRRGEGR